MHPGVPVLELVDAVQHVGDQLLEEDPRRDPDPTTELAGERRRQIGEVGVIHDPLDPLRLVRSPGVEVADLAAQLDQGGQVEAGQPKLHGPWVVVPAVGAEVGRQALGQRRQARDPAGSVVERRGAGDDEEQPGEPAGVNLVHQLPQGVQRFVADVPADPLQRLDLVQHQQQPRVACVAQHR